MRTEMFTLLDQTRKRATILAVTVTIGLASLFAGCGRDSSVADAGFDISAPLVDRMRVSCNAVRDKMAGGVETLDGEEMMSLMMPGHVSPFHVRNDEVSQTRWKPWASGRP